MRLSDTLWEHCTLCTDSKKVQLDRITSRPSRRYVAMTVSLTVVVPFEEIRWSGRPSQRSCSRMTSRDKQKNQTHWQVLSTAGRRADGVKTCGTEHTAGSFQFRSLFRRTHCLHLQGEFRTCEWPYLLKPSYSITGRRQLIS